MTPVSKTSVTVPIITSTGSVLTQARQRQEPELIGMKSDWGGGLVLRVLDPCPGSGSWTTFLDLLPLEDEGGRSSQALLRASLLFILINRQ